MRNRKLESKHKMKKKIIYINCNDSQSEQGRVKKVCVQRGVYEFWSFVDQRSRSSTAHLITHSVFSESFISAMDAMNDEPLSKTKKEKQRQQQSHSHTYTYTRRQTHHLQRDKSHTLFFHAASKPKLLEVISIHFISFSLSNYK